MQWADENNSVQSQPVQNLKSSQRLIVQPSVLSPNPSHPQVGTSAVSEPEIRNLCEFLNANLKMEAHSGAPIGKVASEVMLDRCYEILDANNNYTGAPTIALTSLTCTIRSCTEQHHDNCPAFEVDDRLLLAATLAQCAFQLEGNWLPGDWTCRDIFIPLTADDSPRVDELQVIQDLGTTIPTKRSSEATLNSLGFALAEILLGRHILASSMDIKQMKDLLRLIAKKYGERSDVWNAVRECIFWSGPSSADGFDDEAFSHETYKLIIWPIIQQYRKHKALPT